ncbi:MAG: hypothetical protein GEU74_01415 [Nitriliruptorales bacterium]|nr:hypothetical protein [Nitriliruptorales bacterium]
MSTTVTLSRGPGTPPAAPALAGTAAEALVLIVAPCNGRFHPVVTQGEVTAGHVVAQVTLGRNGSHDVTCPVGAAVQGLLTRPGQLVTRGQALAWAQVTRSAV